MVLSSVLAFSSLIEKRLAWTEAASDFTGSYAEMSAALVLGLEVFIKTVYEYNQCINLYTDRCLVALQDFQVFLILGIFVSEAIYKKYTL
jgi:hypothetical protein